MPNASFVYGSTCPRSDEFLPTVRAWIDGGLGERGGSVGIVFEKDGILDEWSWIEDDHRGNSTRVELLGSVHFLSCLEKPSRVFLFSDCEFVCHVVARLHRPNGRKIRADQDLLDELRLLLKHHSVDIHWATIVESEGIRRADHLATVASRGVGKKPVSWKPVQQPLPRPIPGPPRVKRNKRRLDDPLHNPVIGDNLLLFG